MRRVIARKVETVFILCLPLILALAAGCTSSSSSNNNTAAVPPGDDCPPEGCLFPDDTTDDVPCTGDDCPDDTADDDVDPPTCEDTRATCEEACDNGDNACLTTCENDWEVCAGGGASCCTADDWCDFGVNARCDCPDQAWDQSDCTLYNNCNNVEDSCIAACASDAACEAGCTDDYEYCLNPTGTHCQTEYHVCKANCPGGDAECDGNCTFENTYCTLTNIGDCDAYYTSGEEYCAAEESPGACLQNLGIQYYVCMDEPCAVDLFSCQTLCNRDSDCIAGCDADYTQCKTGDACCNLDNTCNVETNAKCDCMFAFSWDYDDCTDYSDGCVQDQFTCEQGCAGDLRCEYDCWDVYYGTCATGG